MSRIIFALVVLVFFQSCNDVDRIIGRDEKTNAVTYSFSCLDSAVGGGTIGKRLEQAGDLVRDLAVSEKSITDEVQTEYGQAFHDQMLKDGTFKLLNNKSLQQKLNTVLNELLAKRTDPTSIKYMVHALDDTAINAFTFGGQVYVTEGMLKECAGKDALLYAIIGHEIGHSERGHIKATIQELELSNKWFGENGATFFQVKKLLTASINQKNELEADYYGIDLTNRLGYDVCTAVAFWKEMASSENSYSQVEDFFRSHPFSNLRSECLTNHLRNNFGKDCGSIKAATLVSDEAN
jgi:predicted Zn-dependent protease